MQDTLKVGDWVIEPASGQVCKDDKKHRLEPKAMAVLVYLAKHAGETVTRSELEESVWQGSIVTYEALTVTINKIRAALEDDSRKPRYIETLSKRGYRLISPVTMLETKDLSSLSTTQSTFHKPASLIMIAVIIIIVSGIFFYTFDSKPVTTSKTQIIPQDVPSIAVIPFSNISGNAAQDYFAAGMTEYIITDLSRLSSLLVISRSSVLGFNSETVNIKEVSQALGVRYVLTGSVLKNGKQMHIAVQLTDASNGVQLWANRFDQKTDNLFTVQDNISNEIVAQLVTQVDHSEQELQNRNHTSSHEAHDYFIRGNALYTSISKEGNSLARDMFLQAIETDPDFANAYGAIALTYIDDYRRKWSNDPAISVTHAFEYANKAIRINNNAAVAHWVLAYAQLYGRKKPEKAISTAKHAIKLYPNYADAYAIIGSAYSFIGRSVDAIRINKHAMRLNPTSSFIYYSNLGRDYYFLKQQDEAVKSLESAIFRNDNYLNAHIYLAATYASLDRIDDANWEVEKILILDPEFSLDYWAKTQPYTSKQRLMIMVTDLKKAGLPK